MMGEGLPEGAPPAGGCCVTAGGNAPNSRLLPTATLPALALVPVHLVLSTKMGANHGQLFTATMLCHDGSPRLDLEEPLTMEIDGAVILD